MHEPSISKHPTEIFGHVYTDRSKEAKNALSKQYCPFRKNECNKPRKSEPHIKVGICSVGYKGDFLSEHAPVIICPNRFIDDVVFKTIEDNYLPKNKRIEWVSEVGIGVGGNVDYVAVMIDKSTNQISDFLCVEFQAAGTTGTPYPAVQELIKYGAFKSSDYNFGINWANEFMKTMMQQVYKKGKIVKYWNKKIVFVIQDVAIKYLHSAVDTSSIRDANDQDEIQFVTFKLDWIEDRWVLKYDKSYSTDLDGINKILGGAKEDDYLSVGAFIENIYNKGKRDGVF